MTTTSLELSIARRWYDTTGQYLTGVSSYNPDGRTVREKILAELAAGPLSMADLEATTGHPRTTLRYAIGRAIAAGEIIVYRRQSGQTGGLWALVGGLAETPSPPPVGLLDADRASRQADDARERSRVLAAIRAVPGKTAPEIAEALYPGQRRAASNAVLRWCRGLAEEGLVERDGEGWVPTETTQERTWKP